MVVPGGGARTDDLVVEKTTAAAPMPKSSLAYPDLCGRHRLQVEVQMMDREIGFLEEELNSLEELQPASRCCEEVNASVEMNPDPLLPLNRKTQKTRSWWKRCIRGILCFNFPSICCCFKKCTCKSRKLVCCGCYCIRCCLWDPSQCPSCKPRCALPRFSCPGYSCGCVLSRRNHKDSCLCPRCMGPCCMCRCLCP